ncbi:MAG: BACON domain-containing carbohydrate-binding protein [Bacteroidota bacterium]
MKTIYKVLLTVILTGFTMWGYSQIQQGGIPYSFEHQGIKSEAVPVKVMPGIDLARLQAEDAVNDLNKDIPWRFGENMFVNFNTSNSGMWNYMENGDKLWRLNIQCPGAYTINLTFDRYILPAGAKLFVYNADQSQVIGAFTEINNQEDFQFATTLIPGDQITIEYFEPGEVAFPGELSLYRVTHGYRDAFDFAKSFGSSGSCNNNVACPEAAGWENEIKSVCMLVSGGSGFCSGSLVNNTNNNGTPYILTANHCYSDPSSWVFWFNWQSSTCSNPGSSPSYNSLSGATLRARNADSDFCLVQINSTPPSNYNVYYSGWNRENVASTSSVGIHHPSGDIKKISFDNNPSTSSDYEPAAYLANSHWKITQWDDGTTEGGSSGSPLYDQNHRIVGQLHGGWASCTSLTADFYGKFSMSWDRGTTAATRLKDWLDPTNISGLTLNGYDPNVTTDPPVANFSASNTNPAINSQVNFTDQSSNNPTSWSWSFSPSTITYLNSTTSSTRNPQVSFNQPGYYTVTLTATNAYGSDSEIKTNYINAISCNFSTLPFTENFSGGALPSCWTIVDNQGNGQVWQFGSISGPSLTAPYAYLDSDGYGSGNTQNADLVTPTLNLSAYTNVTLQFSHYFRSYSGSSGTLSYSINNGSTWTTISTYTANTANPAAFSQVIAAVAGQSQVKFKWNYTGTWGYYWAVDNIQITGSTVSPTLSVTPSNQNVTPPAGSTAFTVTSNSAWTAVSSQGWCTVTPSGTGNGTITATYTENNTASQRVANVTVTVTGLSPVVVTVTQAAPTLAVTPANQNVATAAGTTPFSVTSNASWTAASNQGWCTVTPSGTGNGTITATFSENTSVTARVANVTVTVNGLTPIVVTVSQAGATPALAVTPSTQNVTAPAGSTAFTVTSNTSWTVISDQTWCTVTPSGSGNGSITATYTQNTTTSPRTANVTVSASGVSPVVVTVVQAGLPESEFLLTIQNVIQTAPNVFEFDIFLLDVDASVPFQLATIQAGINFNTGILNGAAITTGMTTIVAGSSDLPSNMAPISVSTTSAGLIRMAGRAAPGAGNGYIVSTVSPGTRIARLRMTNSVNFAAGTYPDMLFTSSAAITPSYATRVAKYEGTVNTQLTVTPGSNAIVEENPILNGPPSLSVSPLSQSVAADAGSFGYTVTSNASWTAVSDQTWCTLAPASGFGNGTIIAGYTQNTGAPRSANITVSVSGLPDVTVVLNQDGTATKTLNLHALLEGLYNGTGTMRQANDEYGPHFGTSVADHITIELHDASTYSIIVHAEADVELGTDGNAVVSIPPALNGNYYLTVKHRNSIEITSASPVPFADPVVTYAFDLPAKAFGDNLLQMIDGYYVIYGGDVNQDGTIDTGDGTPIDNDQFMFVSGYVVTDVNGDGTVDTGDGTIVDNNQFFFVGTILP